MYTIIGSGFGLYGYLPALVDLGEMVVLPRRYEDKVRGRPELAPALSRIRWVADTEAALASCDAVIIATDPGQQPEVVERCLSIETIRRLVLEKPVAATPARAAALLTRLDTAGKEYAVGYSLLHVRWLATMTWPHGEAPVDLTWSFTAHHFARGLHNWKRSHAAGGGVLRFFGTHVIALLAFHGYVEVNRSEVFGEHADHPERWDATFSGPGIPDCRVHVDSRASSESFMIRSLGGSTLVSLRDPFDGDADASRADRRVAALKRMLKAQRDGKLDLNESYRRTNDLWAQAEARLRAPSGARLG